MSPGFTGVPQSTATTTRWTRSSPVGDNDTSTTSAAGLPKLLQ